MTPETSKLILALIDALHDQASDQYGQAGQVAEMPHSFERHMTVGLTCAVLARALIATQKEVKNDRNAA